MTYNQNNIFAKIIRGEAPAKKIYEDDNILAFHDISRAAPIHALVIPKGEYVDFPDFINKAGTDAVTYFFRKIADIAHMLGADESGYRLISNIGSDAHQAVPHFHLHILAGKKMGPLISSDNKLR